MAFSTTNMGIRVWDQPGDFFSYSELAANWAAVDVHDHTSGKGLQIPTAGIANLAVTGAKIATSTIDSSKIIDGTIATADYGANSITSDKLALVAQQQLGLTSGSQVGRGYFTQAAAGTRTNVAYGAVSNGPDAITGVVLPAGALIVVGYQAVWQATVAGGATRAAIFIGANQLKTSFNSGITSPQVQEISLVAAPNQDNSLSTYSNGLQAGGTGGAYTGDVTTGQIIGTSDTGAGGMVFIFAAAGTYDVSVQFKSSSGTVTAKNRQLWVLTIAF